MVIWDIFIHFWAVAKGFIFTTSDSFYSTFDRITTVQHRFGVIGQAPQKESGRSKTGLKVKEKWINPDLATLAAILTQHPQGAGSKRQQQQRASDHRGGLGNGSSQKEEFL
jgi:hypothetical protein